MMSGTNEPKLIVWDSCVFLGWFNGEEDKPLSDMEALLERIRDGKIIMVVPAVVCVEVLNRVGASDAGTQFREFCKRSGVVRASIDFRVAELAATYRELILEAHSRGEISTSLKAPDALIVATSVIYRADVLHTFDPLLLELSESALVGGMLIVPPDESIDHNQPLFDASIH